MASPSSIVASIVASGGAPAPPLPAPPSPEGARAALLCRLERGELELPLLPRVAQEVLAETEREDGEPRRLAELIRRDAAMAAHVLRVANSPLYLPPTPIVSLQQAISRLGMAAMRRIALMVACQARVFRVAGYDAAMRSLFQHSLAAAAFAQEIARLRRSNVEEAFLCGLLHDVGRPVILQTLADLGPASAAATTVAPSAAVLDPAAAYALADELHPLVGATLAERWSLPPWLALAVRHHHEPGAGAASALAATVGAADRLAHLCLHTRELDEEACRRGPQWALLNLYPDQVDALLGQRERVLAVAHGLA